MALLARTDIVSGKIISTVSVHQKRFKDPLGDARKTLPVLKLQTKLNQEAATEMLDRMLRNDEIGLRMVYITEEVLAKYHCSAGKGGDIQLVFPSMSSLLGFLDRTAHSDFPDLADIGFAQVVELRDKISSHEDRGKGI
jgi:hypothetical protein